MIVGRFSFEVTEAKAASIDPHDGFTRTKTTIVDGPTEIDLSAFEITPADLRTRTQIGDVALVALAEDASAVGAYWLCPHTHRDTYFGRWSTPDDRFAYGHQLFVAPQGRGQGLATGLLLLGRHVAFTRWGLGVRNMVASTNPASVRAHARAGYQPVCTLHGIRVGERTVRRVRSHA